MESRKTKGGEYDFGGPKYKWYTCLIHIDLWGFFQYKDSGTGELGGLSFFSDLAAHVEFCKRFVYLAGMYHYVWMFQVKRKYCC